jgi:hypothetical protein
VHDDDGRARKDGNTEPMPLGLWFLAAALGLAAILGVVGVIAYVALSP